MTWQVKVRSAFKLKYAKEKTAFYEPEVVYYCIAVDLIKVYLEIKNYSPYQPKDNWWSSICDVSGMDVNKFDLKS